MSCTFCPNCANLLLVEECSGGSGLRFCCATCPYIYEIDKEVRPFSRRAALVSPLLLQITHVVPTQCKEVDDVLGGDAAWANVDSTTGAPPPAHAAPPASAHLSLAAPRTSPPGLRARAATWRRQPGRRRRRCCRRCESPAAWAGG